MTPPEVTYFHSRPLFFLCPNPTPPACATLNRGIACNPNYQGGGALKAASWVAANKTRQPTHQHQDYNPRPPHPVVPLLPLRQHSRISCCFHKYLNLNVSFINPNGFSVDVRWPEKEWQIIGTVRDSSPFIIILQDKKHVGSHPISQAII